MIEMMEDALTPLLVVYPLLVLLFHRGGYPPTPPSPSGSGRRFMESAMVLVAVLRTRLLKAMHPGVFTWITYTISYLVRGLGLFIVLEKPGEGRDLRRPVFRLPTDRRALTLFTGLLIIQLVGGVARHLLSGTRLPYLNMYFFSGVVIVPLVEETLFRGLVQTRLETAWGSTWSWVASGCLFGFYHLWAHYPVSGRALTLTGIMQVTTVTLFGMLLGVLFAKTRSLLPPFLLHAVNNFVATQTW